MFTLGKDCDIQLYHQSIDNGAPYGFLLDHSRLFRGNVSVFRSAYKQADGGFEDQQTISFTLLLGTGLVNPDGGLNSATTSEWYGRLFALLDQRSEIGVITPEGVFSGLHSAGNYALEDRAGGVIRVTIQLSSEGDIFAPADRDRFEQSLWVKDADYSGSMTWENSYWRA